MGSREELVKEMRKGEREGDEGKQAQCCRIKQEGEGQRACMGGVKGQRKRGEEERTARR